MNTADKKIPFEFTFHKVGHGLFYSGVVGDKTIVYDCGSLRKYTQELQNCIDRFVNKDNKIVDLLIVSHFHYDHTSGIPTLIKKITDLKRVVIPFLPLYQRIYTILRAPLRRGDDSWIDYIEFVFDPVSYIRNQKHNDTSIFIIDSHSERNENTEENFNDDDNELYQNPASSTLIEPEEPQFYPTIPPLERYSDRFSIYRKSLWRLDFYYNRGKEDKIENEKIDKIKKGLQEWTDQRKLKEALSNEKGRKKISNIYRTILGQKAINLRSLVAYHYFTQKHFIYGSICNEPHPFASSISLWNCHQTIKTSPCFGQLLTGDVTFNQETVRQIQKHFKNITEAAVSLIPHHGSKISWENGEHLGSLKKIPVWVNSAGTKLPITHPYWSVIYQLLFDGKTVLFSSDKASVNIVGEVFAGDAFLEGKGTARFLLCFGHSYKDHDITNFLMFLIDMLHAHRKGLLLLMSTKDPIVKKYLECFLKKGK